MTRPWKERKAQMPGDSNRTPGAGETLETIWRGVARLTGQEKEAMEALRRALDGPDFSDETAALEDVAGQAQDLVLYSGVVKPHEPWQMLPQASPDEERGYRLLYNIIIEPFQFLDKYERKDAT